MPSSTSSSEAASTASDRPGVAQPVPVRDVPDAAAGALMLLGALLLAAALTGAWEWHWRAIGAVPGQRDDDAAWARQRRRIDAGEGNATVLHRFVAHLFRCAAAGVGATFRAASDPACPARARHRCLALEDLAEDQNFKGRLLVGVAPDLFFTGRASRSSALAGYRKEIALAARRQAGCRCT